MKSQNKTQPRIPTVTIDGVEYPIAGLNKNAKALVSNIRMADREIKRLEEQLQLARIARQALGNSLRSELTIPNPDPQVWH